MLRNVFSKSIFERRFSTLFWAIAIAGFSIMIISLFPTFRDTFGEALQNVPEGLRKLMGEANSYRTISGYLDTILLTRIIFLTLIMGIVMGTSLLSGEENDGRLQTLLTQPISRTTVYWQKYAAMGVVILLALAGMLAGGVVGGLLIGELGNLDIGRLLLAAVMVWLLTMVFSSLAFTIGGLTGMKSISGVATGFLAFALYLINSLAGTATVLENINTFSPFKYFNSPGILEQGIQADQILILAGASILLAVIGWVGFLRRDVYQK